MMRKYILVYRQRNCLKNIKKEKKAQILTYTGNIRKFIRNIFNN